MYWHFVLIWMLRGGDSYCFIADGRYRLRGSSHMRTYERLRVESFLGALSGAFAGISDSPAWLLVHNYAELIIRERGC